MHRPLLISCLAALLLSACSGLPNNDKPIAKATVTTTTTATDTSAATTTAIANVTVIDAINGSRPNQTVIYSGDKIIAVQAASMTYRADTVIDGSGKYLIPGLWDFHVHLSYDDRFSESMSALFLNYGITSVRDTGGLLDKVVPLVDIMRAEGAQAPRVFFAGPLLDGNDVVYDGNARPEIGVRNTTAAEARATITELKARGVDFIKIYEMVSPTVFAAMVEAADELGLPIDSHVPLSMRASVAGPMVDSIEHLRNIEMDCAANAEQLHAERLMQLANEGGISGYQLRSNLHQSQRLSAIDNYSEQHCDKTLASLMRTLQVPTLRLNTITRFPPSMREGWTKALALSPLAVQQEWAPLSARLTQGAASADARFADWSLFLTGRMYQQGIPIAAGTDTPIGLSVPGFSLHSELEMLVQAGLPPIEAIRAATLRPAEYFSLQHKMGSIDVGKRADLVLLDKNPLLNIRHTRSITAVISKGSLVPRD
ncbi:MAG: imidazolonepropionase-like amidohydrolase [Paraglaciecola psychrophila]|jgi:imidazolonepropionase-like amidohydrolase